MRLSHFQLSIIPAAVLNLNWGDLPTLPCANANVGLLLQNVMHSQFPAAILFANTMYQESYLNALKMYNT